MSATNSFYVQGTARIGFLSCRWIVKHLNGPTSNSAVRNFKSKIAERKGKNKA